jgi:hypothetical protein
MLNWIFGKKESPKYTCRDCKHYAMWRSFDRVLPDKTVIRGKLEYEECRQSKNEFELKDIEPCPLFKKRSQNSPVGLAVSHLKLPSSKLD